MSSSTYCNVKSFCLTRHKTLNIMLWRTYRSLKTVSRCASIKTLCFDKTWKSLQVLPTFCLAFFLLYLMQVLRKGHELNWLERRSKTKNSFLLYFSNWLKAVTVNLMAFISNLVCHTDYRFHNLLQSGSFTKLRADHQCLQSAKTLKQNRFFY